MSPQVERVTISVSVRHMGSIRWGVAVWLDDIDIGNCNGSFKGVQMSILKNLWEFFTSPNSKIDALMHLP